MLLVLENEVDPRYRYFGDALRGFLGDVESYEFVDRGGRPSLDGIDGVVVSGSTAGVYENDDHPWMDDEAAFIRSVVDADIPTLGICFGHQLVNEALGGRVEHRGLKNELVSAELATDPIFDGVNDVIPAVHGDFVVELGAGMEPIARADYYEYFATKHTEKSVWTTQFHPEFTDAILDNVREDFGWIDNEYDWGDVNGNRVLENFENLVG